MNKKISVIVPIYNCEKYLKECIESLINQTYTNVEIILVDDGSQDNSQAICMHYSNIDKRIRYYSKSNGGASSARNYGITKAIGDYIAFADADDCMTKNMLYEMYELIENENADVAIVSFFCDKSFIPINKHYEKAKVESFDSVSAVREMHIGNKFQGHLWNKLFKKELFVGEKFNEKVTINEDMLLVQTLLFKSKKIVFCNIPLYYYRLTENSALRSSFKESDLSGRQACLLMRDEIQNKCSELLPYANKSIVFTDMGLLEKLYYSKMTGASLFNTLVQEIKKLNCNEIYRMICKDDLRSIVLYKSLLLGKYAYLLSKETERVLRTLKHIFVKRKMK